MKKALRKLFLNYRESRLVLPLTVFLFLIFFASAAVFVLELPYNKEFTNLFDGIWWAVITFSTTGYGDKVPVTGAGKAITIFTITIGIAAMSFLSGTLASVLVERNTRARRGLMDYRKLKDHIIICGWKENMREILLDIIKVSGILTCERIVVVSNVEPDKVDELKEVKELQSLKFVRGDYFSEPALKRANAANALKVIVLADVLESAASSEIDSKTVMTVLSVKAMAPDVFVCAELLDSKYAPYLKQAHCDEIVYIRDLSMHVIAGTAAVSGMSHILFEIVNPATTTTRIMTMDIPGEYVNKKYVQLRDLFPDSEKQVLLGLLENTGTSNAIKMESLREAQKTSDVSMLVNNLQKVKTLEANKPVFLPPGDYPIQRYSKAIIMRR